MNKERTRWILHVDGDGFFAYCELTRFPHLRGKPVVVGEERGIACATTYEAKALGITRAMPLFKIREQFPQVIILPCHFELYEHYAKKFCSIVENKVAVFERYSIDECFASVLLPAEWSKEQCTQWLMELKQEVQSKLGITYSFGLARTKVLAKVASKYQKPDGCTVLMPEEETDVLKATPIKSLWGIGYRLAVRFDRLSIRTAHEFAQWKEALVKEKFALPVQELWQELNGRPVLTVGNSRSLPKSLQSTRSFMPFSSNREYVRAELLHNIDTCCARMRKYDVATKHVSIFLKTSERKYHSIAIDLPVFTNNALDMNTAVSRAMDELFASGSRYKATGVSVWGLRSCDCIQIDLFGEQTKTMQEGGLGTTIDSIRARFGRGSISVASMLPSIKDRAQKASLRSKTDTYVSGLPLPYLGEAS